MKKKNLTLLLDKVSLEIESFKKKEELCYRINLIGNKNVSYHFKTQKQNESSFFLTKGGRVCVLNLTDLRAHRGKYVAFAKGVRL